MNYNTKMNFTFESLKTSRKSVINLRKLYLEHLNGKKDKDCENGKNDDINMIIEECINEFEKSVLDNLNMARAISYVWKLAKYEAKDERIAKAMLRLDEIMGIDLINSDKYLNEIKEKEENINKKENFILGILGVIGVALLGILAYVLAGIAGYYVWAIPAFLTATAFSGYKHLAGKISVISAFIIFILLAISLFIATFLEYTWRLYSLYKEEYIVTFMEVLKEAPQIILEIPDIKSAFTRDLLVNGGILILGFIIAFISAYKSEDRFAKIKKIDDNKM